MKKGTVFFVGFPMSGWNTLSWGVGDYKKHSLHLHQPNDTVGLLYPHPPIASASSQFKPS